MTPIQWMWTAVGVSAIGILWHALRSKRRPSAPVEPLRPADGLVERKTPPGHRRTPNSRDDAIGRFVAFEGAAPRPRRLVPRRRAPRLLGEILLWQVFIGRDGRRWSDEEISLAYEATERAGVWLEGEATRWGAPMNVAVSSTYFEGIDDEAEDVEIGFQFNGEEVGPSEGNAEVRIITSAGRVAAAVGFDSLVDLVEKMTASLQADAHVWLIHVRRRGQSFAIAPDTSPIPGLTLACCYLREAAFVEPLRKRGLAADPVTIAHELLHLFGAGDKYGMPLSSFPKDSTTRRDIMRLSVERLNLLRVDRLTAAEIGWIGFESENGPNRPS